MQGVLEQLAMSYLKKIKPSELEHLFVLHIWRAQVGTQKFPSRAFIYGDPQGRTNPLLQPMEAESTFQSENSPPSLGNSSLTMTKSQLKCHLLRGLPYVL